MGTMAMSSGAAVRSTLNPNAPLYIPAAFQQVEDFSPEWWELVKTTTWFRDHWFRQHQEQENFNGDDEEDVTNLLPDSFDLGLEDELSILEAEFEAAAYHHQTELQKVLVSLLQSFENDEEAVIWSRSLKSPKKGRLRLVVEPAKHREKPMQYVSPKCSPRHIIQQPR